MTSGKMLSYLDRCSVRADHELLQAGHRYLDVRTVDDFNVGHAVGAVNIPHMYKVNGSGLRKQLKVTHGCNCCSAVGWEGS